ncbi:MAG: alpha/beta hydrolase [Fimbriimonadaceae bacterium]|nr:alpha/beta hydrolase [Fimbriimonadaceae bacterium]
MSSETFVHRFVPATNPEEKRTLLLLHGTGGNENDLIPLGETVLPGAAILSPRGHIDEHGAFRFFRRFAEGVFDIQSIREEAAGLAGFIAASARKYGFDPSRVVTIGFSNGANIGHSLMCLHPDAVHDGVFIRAMVTLPDLQASGLAGKRAFLSTGKLDPIVPNENALQLEAQLTSGGAEVTHHWVDAGHNLTRNEIDAIRVWLAE